MADLDQAIAAAREADARCVSALIPGELPGYAVNAILRLRDLLAALDAARGEAVAFANPDDMGGERFHAWTTQISPDEVALYAAPPAALAVPDAAALAARLDKALGCHADSMPKEAYFEVDAVMRALLAQQPAAAVPGDVARDAARYRWLRDESWAGYNVSKRHPKIAETIAFVDGMAGGVKTILAEDALDAAIDRAMLASAERKGEP